MKIYIVTVEQAYVTENGEKVLKEYMSNKSYDDVQSAETAYFTRCSELSNAIGNSHKYAAIKMTTSEFGEYVNRQETFGTYVEQ